MFLADSYSLILVRQMYTSKSYPQETQKNNVCLQ